MKRIGGKFVEYAIVEVRGGSVLIGHLEDDTRFSVVETVRTSLIEELQGNEAETMNTLYELGEQVTDKETIDKWKLKHYAFFEHYKKK